MPVFDDINTPSEPLTAEAEEVVSAEKGVAEAEQVVAEGTVEEGVAPEEGEVAASASASVGCWVEKIVRAKQFFEEDFARMRKNMEFATGYQWEDQANIDDPRYVANMTLRAVNQKVAQLYARNPKVTAKRTRRMDFQMWDGRIESIQQSAALQMNPMATPADQMAAAALMADYTQGRQQRDMIDKVGQTMEHLFSYE